MFELTCRVRHRGGQEQLLDWLNDFVFPVESRFGDKHYAKKVYSSVVRRLLDCGVCMPAFRCSCSTDPLYWPFSLQTTTCCYYGTTHLVGDKVLVDVVHASGELRSGHLNFCFDLPLSSSARPTCIYRRKSLSTILLS